MRANDLFLRPAEASRVLRVSESTIYALARRNEIPHEYVHGRLRIPAAELEEFIPEWRDRLRREHVRGTAAAETLEASAVPDSNAGSGALTAASTGEETADPRVLGAGLDRQPVPTAEAEGAADEAGNPRVLVVAELDHQLSPAAADPAGPAGTDNAAGEPELPRRTGGGVRRAHARTRSRRDDPDIAGPAVTADDGVYGDALAGGREG